VLLSSDQALGLAEMVLVLHPARLCCSISSTSVTMVAVCLRLKFLRYASRDLGTVLIGRLQHCNVQLWFLPWELVSKSVVLVLVWQK